VGDVIARIFSHWVLLLLVVAIAAAGAGVAFRRIKPSYVSTSSVLLVPPATASDPNPLLSLDNNLSQLAVVLGAALESNASREQLARQQATADFTIESIANPSPNLAQLSARIEFTATDLNRAAAVRTANILVNEARAQLVQLQDQTGIDANNQVRVLKLAGASPPLPVGNSRLRATGIAGAGIVVLGCVVIIIVDSVQLRRRRRLSATGRNRRRARHNAADATAAAEQDDDVDRELPDDDPAEPSAEASSITEDDDRGSASGSRPASSSQPVVKQGHRGASLRGPARSR
jgi:capsular polysaccharide biosynthesis protein